MNKDLDQLGYLRIASFVFGGLIGLFSLFPIFHFVIGALIVSGDFAGEVNPPPPIVGVFFMTFGAFAVLFGMTLAVMNLLTARFLGRQRKYLFCLVTAGVNCMFAPIGTVLGVLTILVLVRDSVKELFGRSPGTDRPDTVPGAWQQ